MHLLAISVWRYHKKKNWFRDLISKSIVYFTGYEYTHVGIYLAGRHYDSNIWEGRDGKLRTGIRLVTGWPEDGPDFCMVPQGKIDEAMLLRVHDQLHRYHIGGRPYNVFKLIVLAFVWPTRWIWRKLGWVPFNSEVFGEVCSGFVDEVFRASHWDLFPEEYEGYTVPGQFTKIEGWKRVETKDVFPGRT